MPNNEIEGLHEEIESIERGANGAIALLEVENSDLRDMLRSLWVAAEEASNVCAVYPDGGVGKYKSLGRVLCSVSERFPFVMKED